jgi:hypothetical protein
VKGRSDTSGTAKVSDVITTGLGVEAGVGGAGSEGVGTSAEESSSLGGG